jgi:hypothetical protein
MAAGQTLPLELRQAIQTAAQTEFGEADTSAPGREVAAARLPTAVGLEMVRPIHQVPDTRDRLRRGEKVEFGVIHLTQRGLQVDEDRVPWEQVGDLYIASRRNQNSFHVPLRSGDALDPIPAREVKRFPVLIAVVREMIRPYGGPTTNHEDNPFAL